MVQSCILILTNENWIMTKLIVKKLKVRLEVTFFDSLRFKSYKIFNFNIIIWWSNTYLT